MEWGYVARHPFKGEVRLEGEKPRTRYVEDWEIVGMLGARIQAEEGQRACDPCLHAPEAHDGDGQGRFAAPLTAVNLKEDGIHVQRHKTAGSTGKRTIYEWTPELRAPVELARQARPVLSPFLFCNRRGEGYIDEETGNCHGWDSMWGRFMDRVLTETKVTERFAEHDLRAKCASNAETLEHARALLSHADARTTEAFTPVNPSELNPSSEKI